MNRPPYPISIDTPTCITVSSEAPVLQGRASSLMPWLVSMAVHIAIGLLLAMLVLFTVYGDPRLPHVVEAEVNNITLTAQVGQAVVANEPTPEPMPLAPRYSITDSPATDDLLNEREVMVSNRGVLASAGGAQRIGPATRGSGPTGIFTETSTTAGGNIKNVVFVIDRSGSMHGTFDDVRQELGLYIGAMTPEQKFAVILFADGEPVALEGGRLLAATRANQEAAVRFLAAVQPAGQTDPLPALKRAFLTLRGADPAGGKLIQLLTDGSFPDNRATLRTIRDQDRRWSVRINTVLYGRYAADASAVLTEIAQQSGGAYRYISPDEIGG